MRVPGIAWWPSKIRHSRTHKLAATLDLLPTIFTIAGVSLPEDHVIDGVDMTDLLFYKNARVSSWIVASNCLWGLFCLLVYSNTLTQLTNGYSTSWNV